MGEGVGDGVADGLGVGLGDGLGDGALDSGSHRRSVADVEHLDAKEFGKLLAKVCDRLGPAYGADDMITPVEQLLGKVSAESTADAGDEPDSLCHCLIPWFGAISSTAANPLSVRG